MRYFKGGGGSSAPTETTVTQTDLPEYVQPYFERLLKRGEAESNQQYTPYQGERLAYFSPDELASQGMTRGYAQAGTPQEYQLASQRAAMLGGPYGSGYQADYLGNTYDAQGYGSGYQAGLVGSGYQAGQQREAYDAQAYQPGYQAGLVGSGYQARDLGLGFGAQGLQSGYQAQDNFSTYNPFARQSGYQAGQVGPEFQQLGYEENINRFMSPYQQAVTDIQKREATRQSEMMGDKTADAAAMSGGLGGYREAIMQAERERNLGTQLSDIQAKGSQAAFQSAQQQLAAERAAGLDASKFGLQQFTAGEQARQAQEQMQQQAFQVSEAARQKAAEMGMTARQQNQAARQAEEQFRQSAFSQTESSRQAQEKFRQSAYQAGEQAVLVHLDFPDESTREDLTEFKMLVSSAGVNELTVVSGKRSTPHPKFFVGSGKAAKSSCSNASICLLLSLNCFATACVDKSCAIRADLNLAPHSRRGLSLLLSSTLVSDVISCSASFFAGTSATAAPSSTTSF